MWSSALFCTCFFMTVICIGDYVASKTRGLVIGMITLCIVYAAGFFSGVIPKDSIEVIGFSKILSAFGLSVVVTNIGTTIDINRFIKESKTVVACVGSLLFMSLCFLTIGSMVWGKEYAMAAIPPVSGGTVATMMTSNVCNEAGRTDLAAYAFIVAMLQYCVSFPFTSFLLRKFCQKKLGQGTGSLISEMKNTKDFNIRFLPEISEKNNTKNLIFTKLLLITYLATLVSELTSIPSAIVCLVFGVLACEIGFLDKNALTKCGMMDILMLCMIASAPACFAALSLEGVAELIVPAIFFLLFGALALAGGGILFGRIFRVDAWLSAAIGLSGMYGFPFSVMIPEQVIASMDLSEEDAQNLRDYIVPKMVVAGFTSVTICSVWIAAIIGRFLFA